MTESIPTTTLNRLPTYLSFLKTVNRDYSQCVSAKMIGNALGLGEIQVRKDLAMISSKGKPKVGYVLSDLIFDLEDYLGYHDTNDAVIVGAGRLGKALLSYEGFKSYGLNIVAAYDNNPDVVGTDSHSGKKILPLERLPETLSRMNIKIGIITVPTENAQAVCDLLVQSGILAIWNFAPIHLYVPENIPIKNENMAISLSVLSKHLKDKIYEYKEKEL